jgi:2'-5' RNA ligase
VMELQSEVERRLASYGPPERFHAHMTLFRVKGGRNVGELSRAIKGMADVEVGRVIFSEFQFKKSTLTPSGPVYEDIATFPLR